MTLNLINDVRWKFQKLNITRANIDCFVFEFGITIISAFSGYLNLEGRKDRKSHSIKCKCLLVSIKLEELPDIYTLSPPPPHPPHTHQHTPGETTKNKLSYNCIRVIASDCIL